jgi:hypothetical protein
VLDGGLSSAPAAQRQATGRAPTTVAPGLGAGRPLDQATRYYFEPRFGADFSNVRVHDHAEAHRAAAGLGAQAFTFGRNIVFGEGQHSPGTDKGRRLLAHELTHVVQQAGAPAPTRPLSHPLDRAEREADRVAAHVVAGEPVRIAAAPAGLVQRAPADEEAVSADEILALLPDDKKGTKKKKKKEKTATDKMIDELLAPPKRSDFRQEDVTTELPEPDDLNPGYVLDGKTQKFGRIEAIDTFTHLAREWAKLHPEYPISVNAISNEGGGQLPFRSGKGHHVSHTIGLDFDISLHDRRGNNLTYIHHNADGSISYPTGGSTALTREFAAFLRRESPLRVTHIFFNDIAAGTEEQLHHDDHCHVRFTYTQ